MTKVNFFLKKKKFLINLVQPKCAVIVKSTVMYSDILGFHLTHHSLTDSPRATSHPADPCMVSALHKHTIGYLLYCTILYLFYV